MKPAKYEGDAPAPEELHRMHEVHVEHCTCSRIHNTRVLVLAMLFFFFF